MARATIPIQTVSPSTLGVMLSFTPLTGSGASGLKFLNDGNTILVARDGGGGSSFKVLSVPDSYGRLGDVTITINDGEDAITAQLPQSLWSQVSGSTDPGYVYVDQVSVSSTIGIAAVRISR